MRYRVGDIVRGALSHAPAVIVSVDPNVAYRLRDSIVSDCGGIVRMKRGDMMRPNDLALFPENELTDEDRAWAARFLLLGGTNNAP